MNDRRLFLYALKLPAGAERAEWLAQACGGDDELREKLTELLRRHEAGEPIPSEWSEAAPLSTVVGAEADANDCGWETMAPDSGSGANSGGSANSNALESLQRLLGQLRQVELRGAGSDAPAGRSASHLSPVPTPGSRYEVLGEIARGGMGVVLKGRDVELGRELAIKILMDRHNDHPDIVQRFVEEAQIGGQLQHPGIAPVYELGQFADHRLFFSMKLVKGETLARLLHDRQSPASERVRFLEIFKQICQTVAYAHSRGVIHRDLKPANVMVGAFGEVQVMDWGLAKVLPTGATFTTGRSPARTTDDGVIQTLRSGSGSDISRATGVSGSQTQMGSVMGTPAYMPPEQALGDVDALDERADVFGLGAILCEILTGQPPYVAEDTMAIHRLAARGATNECSARLAECGADAELVSLTKQCLEGEPAARPRNAGVLADRITDYLDSVEQRLRAAEVERATESARAEEAVEKARMHQAAARAERRARKLQVGLAAVVAVVLAIGGLAASWSAFVQDRLKREAQGAELEAKAARDKERQQRDIAVKARGVAEREEARAKDAMLRAEREATHALQMLADMQTDHGLEAGRNGQSAEAALWFANAALLTPLDPQRQLANHRRAQGWLDRATKFTAVFTRPDEQFQEVRFQPAGRLALILTEQRLHVWDWRAGVALDWPEALGDIAGAAWAPDGQSLAISFQSGDVRLVEPESGAVKHQFQGAESAKLLVWSPDGGRLALAGDQVQVWRVTDKPERELALLHPRRVYGVSFNRAGTRLITGCEDDLARVFSIGAEANESPLFAPLEHAPQHKSQSSAPSFCDDDRRIATVAKKKLPALWDAMSGALASPSWRFPSYTVDRCMAVDPRGTWIAVGAGRSCILLASMDAASNCHIRIASTSLNSARTVAACSRPATTASLDNGRWTTSIGR